MNANFMFSDKKPSSLLNFLKPTSVEGFKRMFSNPLKPSLTESALTPIKSLTPALSSAIHSVKSFKPANTFRSIQKSVPPKAFGWIVAGLAAGVAIAYFLDSKKGAERRSKLQDQLSGGTTFVKDQLTGPANFVKSQFANYQTNLANKQAVSAPTAMEPISDVVKASDVDDSVLENRIKSQFGRKFQSLSSIETSVLNGMVTLSGSVPQDQIQKIVSSAQEIEGVKKVINNLEPLQSPQASSGKGSRKNTKQNDSSIKV